MQTMLVRRIIQQWRSSRVDANPGFLFTVLRLGQPRGASTKSNPFFRVPTTSSLVCRFSSFHARTDVSSTCPHLLARNFSSQEEATRTTNPSITAAVQEAAALLPHQAIIEKFVHHNPLKALEDHQYQGALNVWRELDSILSPGERALHLTGVNPRWKELSALCDLSAVFLDRGASKWTPSFRDKGFLYFFASLEGLGGASWRKHARMKARDILKELERNPDERSEALAAAILEDNLRVFGIPPEDWGKNLVVQLRKTKGWAGMFARMEHHPEERPANTKVSLLEYCAVESILARSAIEAVAKQGGWKPKKQSLADWLAQAPTIRPLKAYENVRTVSGVAYADQDPHRVPELENSFEVALLTAIHASQQPSAIEASDKFTATEVPAVDVQDQQRPPDLQFIACIDDRIGSVRRLLEEIDPNSKIETFGVPGYFGLPFTYKKLDEYAVFGQAPDGYQMDWHVKEIEDPKFPGQVDVYKKKYRVLGNLHAMWERLSFSPVGSLLLSTLAPFSLARLLLIGYSPLTLDAIRRKTRDALLPRPATDLETAMPPDVAAAYLAPILHSIGIMRQPLAPVVVVMGHGASSVNNPFSNAYNCGACAGNRGGVNARLFAWLGNMPRYREILERDHGIIIPPETIFVGVEHDTTSDTFEILDEEDVPQSHLHHIGHIKLLLERTLAENALERCHRFMLADHIRTPDQAMKHVLQRSVDLAEVRPELNHATNAAVVVGRRTLTKGVFMDRRTFLASYDPFGDDEEGTQLEYVLDPSLNVCSGINLEYLFSTVANDRYGSGTKAPLNAVGNVGVQQGTNGDLRTGLPSQMVEFHIPVRALFVIDSPVERIEKVMQRRPDLRDMVKNNWVRVIARDPQSGEYYRCVDGAFKHVHYEAVVQPGRQLSKQKAWSEFQIHYDHGMAVKNREDVIYGLSTLGMIGALAGPLWNIDSQAMMNPHGDIIAACATTLSLPVLAFSRRYLHGEYMFSRFSILSAGLLFGFNLVATAPNLKSLIAGWGLFGFASTFLIASYTERPSVCNNATYAFAAYRLADFALITALAFAGPHAIEADYANPELVAGSLLVAALFKSSQIPLTALFARSMEGPTPTSALGYAGLSAHAGVVLLSSTLDLWFPYDGARMALAAVGGSTAVYAGLVSKIHADRKGALAYATSATLGLIYCAMAAGYVDLALALSMGHASFRTVQVLTAPGAIDSSKRLAGALDGPPFPRVVPDYLYRACWALHRVDTDSYMENSFHRLYSPFNVKLNLSPSEQWAAKAVGVTIAGFPGTPVADTLDEVLVGLLPTDPALAAGVIASHYVVSVLTMRFLFLSVLNSNRYHMTFTEQKTF